MKATQDQIEMLVSAMPASELIRQHGAALAITGRYANGEGNLAQRVRWDAFWAIPSPVRGVFTAAMYGSGANDDHIDTALRRAMLRIGLPEFAQ